MAKSGWHFIKIEQLASNKKHALAMGPFGSRITKDNFVNAGVPVIRGGNLSNGRFDHNNLVFLTEEKANELTASNVVANDLVFTHRGTLGQVGIVPNGYYPRYVASQSQMKLTCDQTKVFPMFLYYFFRSSLGQHEILSHTGGSGVPAISSPLTTLKNVTLYLPPLPTQRKIASILSAYDDLIENNTRRIAILEEIAQSLYREWFVHFRYPGHEKDKMVESELGMIPEGWNIVNLGEIAEVNLKSMKKGQEPEIINYVDINSVSTGHIHNINAILFSEAPGRARRIVQHGDIIWSTVRPNRRSYSLIIKPIDNLVVSTGFAVISAQNVPYTYLYNSLTTNSFVDYLVNHATGAAYPAVNSNDFLAAQILRPPSDLLDLFHTMVTDILSQKYNLLQKNNILRRTRDLLLPKLISGEIDVETSDITIPDIPDGLEPEQQKPHYTSVSTIRSEPIDATQMALPLL